ncbi:hypothetical protein [Streptomyces shenzhenensis]|uniref:Uncharacterized protein n=1 Tax=Streptomyces shenzhenensis TaxID=943815 RepID=A0A3M0HWH6_9ACTN|nr:hypothetical protein [Streptomyces shenzhenensis]RMB80370.1 hypothetical protein CTZ28_40370 [Streptomyces shenzhenensis]
MADERFTHGGGPARGPPDGAGQEDRLAALGLVLNAVVLRSARYLDAAAPRPYVRVCPAWFGPRGLCLSAIAAIVGRARCMAAHAEVP